MEENSSPQINASKLRIGGGIVGVLFTIGTMMIFLIGIPILRYIFPAAIVLGCGLALIRHFVRRKTPGAPWLLAATENTKEASSDRELRLTQGPLREFSVTVSVVC
jgi:branched-subunit amino acid permease